MSRVGKKPVDLPVGVSAAVNGDIVKIKGPLGELEKLIPRGVSVAIEGAKIIVAAGEELAVTFGTVRALVQNMVSGVSKGWKRQLEFNGVGFGVTVAGKALKVTAGYSHPVELEIPAQLKCTVEKNVLTVEGINKETVGTFVAKVRAIRPPDPYLGKGFKEPGEKIRRKAGKSGKK